MCVVLFFPPTRPPLGQAKNAAVSKTSVCVCVCVLLRLKIKSVRALSSPGRKQVVPTFICFVFRGFGCEYNQSSCGGRFSSSRVWNWCDHEREVCLWNNVTNSFS